MQGKKDLAAFVLARTGALRCARALHRPKGRLLILAYHRVLPPVDPASYPFDLELISATPEDFAWQVGFLVRHFSVVGLNRVVESLKNPTLLPQNAVVITFDDGFADNFEHAYPVLRRCGVPATIFLTTDFIGQQAPIWYEMVSFVLLRAPIASLPSPNGGGSLPTSGDISGRRADLGRVLAALKRCSEEQRQSYLRLFQAAAGPDLLLQAGNGMSRSMTWDHVREMSRNGIEFGSHTVTHPILTRVSETQLATELLDSRMRIEAELGCHIPTLAYPVGGATAFDARVSRAASEAGFATAVSYMPGENRVDRLERFALRRLAVERYTSRERFAAMLTAPTVFG